MGKTSEQDSDAHLNDPLCRHLGISFTTVSDGVAVAQMRVTEDHLNMNGTLHGGAIFSLADSAAGAALESLLEDTTSVALEANISFLTAAEQGDTVTAKAEVTNESRKTAEMTVNIVLFDGTEIATFRGRGYKV
ncbi:PaaI family thioesterase [Halobellus captivus]|uniref:PaaI family thioesterase n=1 Tax=Halobellus captivus TaxID=2592614 RepID=UPI00119EBCBD|nr:PaaI family thioesterase [Halobellus captivus]